MFKVAGLVETSELQDVSNILVKALVLMAQQKHIEKVQECRMYFCKMRVKS